MAENFNFELVSPEHLLLSQDVQSVVVSGSDGEMTILANHSPTMSTVKPGIVTVTNSDGKENQFVVLGGFLDVLPTGCTLLAQTAMAKADFSTDDMQSEIDDSQALVELADGDIAISKANEYCAQLKELQAAL